MKKFIYFTIMASILSLSCNSPKQKADFIIINAKIYTVNNNFDTVQSFAIRDGKFIGVGSTKSILDKYSSDKTIDLNGKSVFPGFYDAHCHFLGYGLGLQEVNLVGTKSLDEVISRIKEHINDKQLAWIIGRGWDQNDWKNKSLPDNEKLSSEFPDIPVVLTRIDGHALLANKVALKKAHINYDSKISGGSYLMRNGRLTGVLVDNAMATMFKVIPVPDKALKQKALIEAQEKCLAVGLTTISDAGLDYDEVESIEELQKYDRLKIRVYAMLNPTKENIDYFVKKGPFTSDELTIRCIKLYADGALGSRGACLIEPYSDDHANKGLLVENPDSLKKLYQIAYKYNYQVATHAIGDSANRIVLKMYGDILKKENDKRWRIEHAQVINKNDFELFKKYSVIPSVQPTHATSDMYWANERLGQARLKYAYAYKTLMNLNHWMPLGSDFPVEDINPLYGFYAAVSRMDFESYPKGGFQLDEALTRQEALKGMTIWAAKANFEENQRGSIEIGKLADFVVLDNDIMEIDLKQIPKVKVLDTYIGGIKVF